LGCSSVAGVLFNKNQTTLIEFPGGRAGSYTISNSVTSIGAYAFYSCIHLTNVTIPSSVTSIGDYAFYDCYNLQDIYFERNAPSFLGSHVFDDDDNLTVYYLQGTTGWSSTYAGHPAPLWNPVIQTTNFTFGVHNNTFGFNITGTTNIPIVVEASTDLQGASWTSLQSCTLTNGSIYFSDPLWTQYPARFYRIRSP
jgi:hypothetical protein